MPEQPTSATQRYSTGAIVLHWLIALCLAFELALGFAMPRDASGFALFQLHKSVGIVILLLTFVRIGWRMTHRQPPPAEGGITGWLAKAVHLGFYVFMILAPLTGWAVASTAPIEIPTLLFGIVPLPHLPLPSGINGPAEEVHELLAWVGLGLFLLHVAGAARHHLMIRDGLLQRMAPAGSNAIAIALSGFVILLGSATWLLADGSSQDAAAYGRLPGEAEAGEMPDVAQRPEAMLPGTLSEPGGDEGALELGVGEPGHPDERSSSADVSVSGIDGGEAAVEADPGPPPVWNIQPGGRLGFSVGDGSGGQIRGGFATWRGSIRFDPENPDSADIRIDVDLASASVGDPTQDEMLAGNEFFAIATGPTATFRTTSVRKTGENRYAARGTLHLRGLSRAQALTFTLSGEGLRRRVAGTATIDRTAFGIGTGSTGGALDSSVSVTFSFDAVGRRP